MKRTIDLNLAYPEVSAIQYTKTKYKDGQVTIKLGRIPYEPETHDITLVSRMNSYDDLFYILAAKDVLNKTPCAVHLYVPCFLGQRSDRRFTEDGSFDLKIITNIINSQNFKTVTILNAHSYVLPALLDRCVEMEQDLFYGQIINDIYGKFSHFPVIISPDAGAYKKVEKVAEEFELTHLACRKVRMEDGRPIVTLPGDYELSGETRVIIDDYCDGGRTFIDLAHTMADKGAENIILVVTHGLFSYGYDLDWIDYIYTTNSIRDITSEKVRQYEVMRSAGRFYENKSNSTN